MGNINTDARIKRNYVRNFIIVWFLIYIGLVSLMLINMYGVLLYTYADIYKNYEKALNTSSYGSKSMYDICEMLECNRVIAHDEVLGDIYYIMTESGLVRVPRSEFRIPEMLIGNITKRFNVVTNVRGVTYVSSNDYIINGLYDIIIYVSIGIFILFTLLYIPISLKVLKNKLLEKGEYKSELESTLARDLTEMLHHEMGAPLGIVKTQISELIANIYPNNYNEICNNNNNNNNNAGLTSEKDVLNVKLIRSIFLGLDRLQAILDLIAGAKHIRFSNGTVPIRAILENIASSVNSFKLKKIEVIGIDNRYFKDYSVIHEYGNGNMLNALHVLFTNAMEALADTIILDAKLLVDHNKRKMEIYIEDNGIGILDKNGNPKKNKDIFKYGWTTKGSDTSEKWLFRMLNFFGFNVDNINGPKRGIGLFITRQMLRNIGGDLEIHETSRVGTIFKLTVPVRKTIY